jgi:hypothetical protein
VTILLLVLRQERGSSTNHFAEKDEWSGGSPCKSGTRPSPNPSVRMASTNAHGQRWTHATRRIGRLFLAIAGLAIAATPASSVTAAPAPVVRAPAGPLHLPPSTAMRASPRTAARKIGFCCSLDKPPVAERDGVPAIEHQTQRELWAFSTIVSVGVVAAKGLVWPILRQLVRKLTAMISVVIVGLQGMLGLEDIVQINPASSSNSGAKSEVSMFGEPLQGARKTMAQGVSVFSASSLLVFSYVSYIENEKTTRRPEDSR